MANKRASDILDARLFVNGQTCMLSLRTVETYCNGTVHIIVPLPNGGKEGFQLLDKLEFVASSN